MSKKDRFLRTQYIFPNNGAAIINGAMTLQTHTWLVYTLRKAATIWNGYNQNVRDAWKEQANQLNAIPLSGLLPSCLEMFRSFNCGVEAAVIKLLFND